MKNSASSCGSRVCLLCFGVMCFGPALVLQGLAQSYILSHKNSSVQIDVGAGASDWFVDGSDQLNQAWFYYRAGNSGPEFPVQNIDATPLISYVNNAALARLDVTYANAGHSVRTVYQLTGGNAGTQKANLNETITLANLSAAPLEFHFFQYSDFDLGNAPGNQTVQYYLNGVTGQYYKLKQTDGTWSVTETINSAAPPIGHLDAATFSQILTSLTDASPTTLNDVLNVGPGNATFAYQWDVVLAPYGSSGSSVQISKLLSIVPEPSSATFLISGLLAFALFRSRHGFDRMS